MKYAKQLLTKCYTETSTYQSFHFSNYEAHFWSNINWNNYVIVQKDTLITQLKNDDEELMLKLKLQYFGSWCKELTYVKRPWCWEHWGQEEKGMAENEMVGGHHWLSGHEFEQILGDSEGQGGLECCSPWGHEESDTTQQLNNNTVSDLVNLEDNSLRTGQRTDKRWSQRW